MIEHPDEIPLHCHHKVYRNGTIPWDSPLEDIITLCPECHARTHGHLSKDENAGYVTKSMISSYKSCKKITGTTFDKWFENIGESYMIKRKYAEEMINFEDFSKEQFEILLKNAENIEGLSCEFVHSKIEELDKEIQGFPIGVMTAVTGDHDSGKTDFMVSVLLNIANDFRNSDKEIWAFFTQGNLNSIYNKLLSNLTEIPVDKLTSGQLKPIEWEIINAKQTKDLPIKIETMPLSWGGIIDLLTAEDLDKLPSVIMIDTVSDCKDSLCLQLLNFAKEHDIALIVTCNQKVGLSKFGYQRQYNEEAKPYVDIIEPLEIQNLADVIIGLNRPESKGIFQDEMGHDLKNKVIIKFLRNRLLTGYKSEIVLEYKKDICRVSSKNEDIYVLMPKDLFSGDSSGNAPF